MASTEESSDEDSAYVRARKQRRNAPAWKKQLIKELLKPKLKRFPRRRVFSPSVDAIWGADLLDIHQYASVNNRYAFILVLIDVFSKYAWARPLKNKTGSSVSRALEEVFNSSKRCRYRLWTDRGTEFYNQNVEI